MIAVINSGVEKAYDLMHQANVYLFEVWLQTTVFTWRWWALAAIALGTWAAWVKWRPKESTIRILYGGSIILLLTYYMDAIGLALGLWSYPTELIPILPSYLTWDFCVIPVASMFTLQLKPKANPIIKAIVLAIIGAYIVQPIATWLGFFHLRHWRHSFSFPLVIIFYLLGYFFYNGRKWENSCKQIK